MITYQRFIVISNFQFLSLAYLLRSRFSALFLKLEFKTKVAAGNKAHFFVFALCSQTEGVVALCYDVVRYYIPLPIKLHHHFGIIPYRSRVRAILKKVLLGLINLPSRG